jgi:hypothetical protein
LGSVEEYEKVADPFDPILLQILYKLRNYEAGLADCIFTSARSAAYPRPSPMIWRPYSWMVRERSKMAQAATVIVITI